jgi:acylphosphatase
MNDKSAERIHATVSGRVQGVGFRGYTTTHAQRLGITGWVRNRFDGTVEILAEGHSEALESFLEAVNTGPGPSLVDHVDVERVDATHEFQRFVIRWTG